MHSELGPGHMAFGKLSWTCVERFPGQPMFSPWFLLSFLDSFQTLYPWVCSCANALKDIDEAKRPSSPERQESFSCCPTAKGHVLPQAVKP
jgi:hypothetical protein